VAAVVDKDRVSAAVVEQSWLGLGFMTRRRSLALIQWILRKISGWVGHLDFHTRLYIAQLRLTS
jgi:hypothetical protein